MSMTVAKSLETIDAHEVIIGNGRDTLTSHWPLGRPSSLNFEVDRQCPGLAHLHLIAASEQKQKMHWVSLYTPSLLLPGELSH